MPGNHKKLLLLFIVFLINGVTHGQNQVGNFSCGQFCLSAQVTCTCTVTGPVLQWRVLNATGNSEGIETLDPDSSMSNTIPLTGASAFGALLTNSTGDTLTGTLTFITFSEYEGYMIECDTTLSPPVRINLTIPGPPLSVNELELAVFTNASVMLTFTAPANSPCINNYIFTTDASVIPPTTNTLVLISKPENDPEGANYFVIVSAVDFEGRTGPSTTLDCFMFSGPNAVIFSPVTFEMQNGYCVASVEWTGNDCLPAITSYNVTVNSRGETIAESGVAPTSAFQVTFGEEYFVTVTPSNTIGIGSPTSTAFMAPTHCPTPREVETSSTPATAEPGSATLLHSNFGGIAVLGAIIAFAISVNCI